MPQYPSSTLSTINFFLANDFVDIVENFTNTYANIMMSNTDINAQMNAKKHRSVFNQG